MAKKKDNTKLIWLGVAGLGVFLWWKNRDKAAVPVVQAAPSATKPKPVATPVVEEYITIPRSNYAYTGEQEGCLDLQSQQSIDLSYCDDAWARYMAS